MKIIKAEYVTSAVELSGLLKNDKPQFAFVGRSNVGKSSLINALSGKKNLAKTSSTPGLTKMVNYFLINDSFYFVDLPGYGFAKTAHKTKKVWAKVIEDYFENSSNLATVFVLLDIRHEPSENDKMMINYLILNQISFKIIATKSDKIAKSKIKNYLRAMANQLNVREDIIKAVSIQSKQGLNEILEYIESCAEVNS